MEEGRTFVSAPRNGLCTLLTLLLYLLDVMLDVWALTSLAQEEEYILMVLLLLLLLASSSLLQIFSWTWYSEGEPETRLEKFVQRRRSLTPLHLLQLGMFLRFAGLLEIYFLGSSGSLADHAQQLKHDLSMLRLFEAFSESAPQLILMLVVVCRTQTLQLFTVVKLLMSLGTLSFTMLSYHRSMRAFVSEKFRMGWLSSGIYFLWNLLLIGPRVLCLALFASVLPCFVPAHFFSMWTLLLFWAWQRNTAFMESAAGEWLYRATVALIWFFSWFSTTDKGSRVQGVVYHALTGVDSALLLGLWCWRRTVESARLGPPLVSPWVLIPSVALVYAAGIALKLLYYMRCHPKSPPLEHRPIPIELCMFSGTLASLETDSSETEAAPSGKVESAGRRRMRNMAMNFYGGELQDEDQSQYL